MLLTLQGQIATKFKTVHLNICTVSDQVTCPESSTQPTEDSEDVKRLVNATSREQSLTNPSGLAPKQSLAHQAILQRREEPLHQPAAPIPISTRESVTLPNVKGLNLLQIQVPEIGLTTTDPGPLIMGMPISHLGYKSQPPPWLGLIQQSISPMTAIIAR